MKFPKNFLPITFLIFSLVACRSAKEAQTVPAGYQLVFGSGGGFTGASTQYILHADGRLTSVNEFTGEAKEVGKVPAKKTDALFKEAAELKLQAFQFSHPGNLYYFVRLKHDSEGPKITWGSSDHPVPAQIQAFYNKLTQTIPK